MSQASQPVSPIAARLHEEQCMVRTIPAAVIRIVLSLTAVLMAGPGHARRNRSQPAICPDGSGRGSEPMKRTGVARSLVFATAMIWTTCASPALAQAPADTV